MKLKNNHWSESDQKRYNILEEKHSNYYYILNLIEDITLLLSRERVL